jgi:hypothetical protein
MPWRRFPWAEPPQALCRVRTPSSWRHWPVWGLELRRTPLAQSACVTVSDAYRVLAGAGQRPLLADARTLLLPGCPRSWPPSLQAGHCLLGVGWAARPGFQLGRLDGPTSGAARSRQCGTAGTWPTPTHGQALPGIVRALRVPLPQSELLRMTRMQPRSRGPACLHWACPKCSLALRWVGRLLLKTTAVVLKLWLSAPGAATASSGCWLAPTGCDGPGSPFALAHSSTTARVGRTQSPSSGRRVRTRTELSPFLPVRSSVLPSASRLRQSCF